VSNLLPDPAFSYTQWEAYLAIYFRKKLWIYRPSPEAPRDPEFVANDTERQSQGEHLHRLQQIDRWPGGTFSSHERLSTLVLQAMANWVPAEHSRPERGEVTRPVRWRVRWISLSIVLLAIACVVGSLITRPPHQQKPDAPDTQTDVLATSESPRIKFIHLSHVARIAASHGEAKGIIGRESFDPAVGDQVRVEVELTRPAYCYIVVFRPDRVAELIFPEPDDHDKPPRLTDKPRYPSKARDVSYGLTNGSGLWVFAACVSDQPLGSYDQAIANKSIPDSFEAGTSQAKAIWWDDGQWMELLTSQGGQSRGPRGAGSTSPGQRAVCQATDWMKSLAGAKGTAAAIGFFVRP
jgi:hypothetical protein